MATTITQDVIKSKIGAPGWDVASFIDAVNARTSDPGVSGLWWRDPVTNTIKVSGGPFSASLDFSDARNSMYLALFRFRSSGTTPPAYSASLDFSDDRNSQYVAVI